MSKFITEISDEEIKKYVEKYKILNKDDLSKELDSKLKDFRASSPDIKALDLKLDFDTFVPDLKKVICKDLKYCTNQKKYELAYEKLVPIIVPFLITAAGIAISVEIACILVIIVLKIGLDIFCECP